MKKRIRVKTNAPRMIRELDDRGLNRVDTAEQYGGGESERRIGAAIQASETPLLTTEEQLALTNCAAAIKARASRQTC